MLTVSATISATQLEETTIELALDRDRLERKRPCVVFYDRGLLDMKVGL